MDNLIVRDVREEVWRALRVRAARHERSEKAEVREILATAVKPLGRVRIGCSCGYRLGAV